MRQIEGIFYSYLFKSCKAAKLIIFLEFGDFEWKTSGVLKIYSGWM
jgi:hypothetical protein